MPEQKAYGELLAKSGSTIIELPVNDAALRRLFE